MKEVTDPEILAKLESKEVTDPELLAKLESAKIQQESKKYREKWEAGQRRGQAIQSLFSPLKQAVESIPRMPAGYPASMQARRGMPQHQPAVSGSLQARRAMPEAIQEQPLTHQQKWEQAIASDDKMRAIQALEPLKAPLSIL